MPHASAPRPVWETLHVDLAGDLPREDAEVFVRVLNRPEGQALLHRIADSLARLQRLKKRKRPFMGTDKVTDPSALPFLLNVQEVAGLMRTTVDGVYAQIERGQLSEGLVRRGKKILFNRDRLLRSLDGLADCRQPKGGRR